MNKSLARNKSFNSKKSFTECEMSALHQLLSRIPPSLPFEELLESCQALYEALPPHLVEGEARKSMEERERAREQERRVARGEVGKGAEGGLGGWRTLLIYGAPVVLGLLVWRLYHGGG